MGAESLSNAFIHARAGLVRAIVRIAPSREVEDIVQETYLRACAAEKNTKIRDPRSYFIRTARNLALDFVKKAESRLVDSSDVNSVAGLLEVQQGADQTFGQACVLEEYSRFYECVGRLPFKCRRVFVLRKLFGLTQRQIAEEVGLSESTVEKHIAQGNRKWRGGQTCTQ